MSAVLSKNIIRTMISHASIVLDDTIDIQYTNAGWRICGMDSSKVALIEINVWSQSMESYEFQSYTQGEESPQIAVIPLDKLVEAMAVLPDDSVISVTDDGVTFRLDSGKYHIKIREEGIFTQVKVPDVKSGCSFGLNTADLNKMLVSAKNIRDEISISCGQDGLTLAIVDDTGLEGMEYTDSEITFERDVSSRYPLDFVVNAFRGMRGDVLMELDNDYLLKVVSTDPFTTMFLLAPRIVSESEE